MTTLSKIIITILVSIFLTSCQWDINFGEGKKGNGNVVSETRDITEDFNVINAAEGLDVYITQGKDFSIEVEADNNIIEYINTDISGGTLHIDTEERIGRAKSKKVYVTLPEIIEISASSGSDVYGQGVIESSKLALSSSSGADIRLEVNTENLICDASSGADIDISGRTINLRANASSGADIDGRELTAENCNADASSGADISINATKELTASASSGGDVRYSGNPEIVNKSKSSAGSVSKN
ncbi:head GIN domain-containing protein [Ascidiimonas sp. W6]|uniref:head GIN domain-containing protein n=1 Tax=Ascidiimonas meishanensis TaxID=3128903 RepID=UPI0030ED9147